MKNLILFSIYLFAFQWIVFSTEAHSLKGVILNEENKQPLIGATIRIVENNQTTATDIFGKFQIDNLVLGTYTLEISYIGFETLQKSVEMKENEPTSLQIYLKPSILQLQDITIQASDKNKINIIGAVDIQLRPLQNSQDILRVVPGLFIAQHAGGGKAEQIFLRGFDIDHGTDINLTVDGMPVNMVSHAHGQGYADLHFLIPELVQNVNFEKGTYYTHKGNFTTAGFVEFNTRNALDKNMLKLEAGQFGTYRLVGMLDILGAKAKENRQSAFIATEYFATQNFFESPQNFNRLNLFAKYHQFIGENKIFTASISTFRSQWDASGQIPQRAVESGLITRWGAIDDTEGGKTDRSNLNFKLTHLLPDGAYITNQVFGIHYSFELYSNFTFFLNDPLNGDQIRQKESRSILGYNGAYNKSFQIGTTNLTMELGANIRYDQVRDNELSRSTARQFTRERLALGSVDETNSAIYADFNFQINPKFNLNAGARLDYFKFEYVDLLLPIYKRQFEEKTLISPKLNLTYNFSERVRAFAKSGFGFHSNDTRVVVAQNGQEILPRALGVEVGMLLKPVKNLLINASIWQLDLEQEFVYVGDEAVVEAGGKTKRQGIDLSIRHQLTDWLFLDLDLNMTRPRTLDVPNEANSIPLAPTFTSIGGLSFRFKNGINGSLRYRQMENRPANEDNSITARGYFLMDAILNYTRPKYEVGISVVNLFNTKWEEAQFDTESRLFNEIESVSEIHYTPGSPFFLKISLSYFF